jgi:bifunctional non-homologous end joining protein LigD
MLALPAETLPTGSEWSYEVKWDGYRCLAEKDGPRVRLHSRNAASFTTTYPDVARAVATLRATRVLLDGEIVALGPDGRPSFQALQHRRLPAPHPVVFYAFDVLTVDGRDLMHEPLTVRRRVLRHVVQGSSLLLSDVLPGTPQAIEREVRALGLEGVIAKRVGSRYEAGQRSGAWTKVKFQVGQELVIGGFLPDGVSGLDSLIVGYYEGTQLLSAGKVRAGLNPAMRRDLRVRLTPLRRTTCPFVNLPDTAKGRWGVGITADEMAAITWVKPQLVAAIGFNEWTRDHHLRHARFLGLRGDVRAKDVRREHTTET